MCLAVLTDVDWHVAVHYVLLSMMTSSLWSWWHCISSCAPCVSTCQGDCVLQEQTKCKFNLLHLFLLCGKSPAGGGIVVGELEGGWGGSQMCMRLWRSRGRVLGEGRRGIVLPPCPPQATEDLIWQLQGGTWKDQNKDRGPPPSSLPPPFLLGKRKPIRLIALWWLGSALCQCRGGGRQAGSVNAYHDHNRANEHSSAMKAQRERLRIPGLTLEWVFSSVILLGWQLLRSV